MAIACLSVSFSFAQMVGTPYVVPAAPLLAGVISSDQTICTNTRPSQLTTETTASGATGSYMYQWQSSANNNTWTNLSGATLANYTPGTLTANTYYRQEVNSGSQTAYSNSVLITVESDLTTPTITLDRTCTYIGGDTAITASVPSIAGATYSWTLSSSSGLQFTQTPAATDNIVSIKGLVDGTYSVSVSISNACGTVTATSGSGSITVRILPNSLDNAKLYAEKYLTLNQHGWWIAWLGTNGAVRYDVYGSTSPMPNMNGVGCFVNPNATTGNQLCPSPEYNDVQVTTGWVPFYMQRVIDGSCAQAEVNYSAVPSSYRYYITATNLCGTIYDSFVASGSW